MMEVVVSLGSNYGDRIAEIKAGIEWLQSVLSDCVSSSIYPTPDCLGGHKEYMNAVVKGKTCIPLRELDRMCKEYEKSQGRTQQKRDNGDVPIDIDIVILDGVIIKERDARQRFFLIGYSMI